MCKFLWSGEKTDPTAPIAPTFCRNTVGTLLSHCRGSVGTLYCTLHSRLSRLKTLFNSRFGSGCRSTSSDFAQEHEKEGNPHDGDGASIYLLDEYDEEDYDGWLSDEEWLDLMDDEEEEIKSWQQRAVDEAIDEEKPGQYPANNDTSIGDIPF